MKWVKVAIGAVIAISVVPIIVLSAINIKKSLEVEEITITIEIEYYNEDTDKYNYEYIDEPFNEMYDYVENGFIITNLYDYMNELNITITNFYDEDGEILFSDNNSVTYIITPNLFKINKTYDSIYSVTADDLQFIDITFSKSKDTTIVTTLLSFVPLVFIGGVLLYFYKSSKKED